MPPMIGGGQTSDEELIEDQGEERTGQHDEDKAYDTDEELVFRDWIDLSGDSPKVGKEGGEGCKEAKQEGGGKGKRGE